MVERLVDKKTFGSVWLGMWWGVETVTTVGYGDVIPDQTVGRLVGPVGDAALLAAAHLGEGTVNGRRILSPESAIEMQRIATEGKKFDLGLGWFRRHRNSERGRTYIEHLGGGGGYGTVMRLYPQHGLGVVAMANVSSQHFKHERLLAPLDELG